MSDLAARPAPIRTDETNPFARFSMATRVPKILDDLVEKNRAFSTRTVDRIHRLRDEIREGAVLRELDPGAPDVDDWSSAMLDRRGEGWLTTDWFFAETLVYRRVIEACRWWENGLDPFVEHKREEIENTDAWQRYERSLREAPSVRSDARARLSLQLLACLWGNRIDLSYPAAVAQGHTWAEHDLLSDDRAWAIERIIPTQGRFDLIADNTGTELLADLALVDSLLQLGASSVTVHVKVHPTFVSDATPADVLATIAAMHTRGDECQRLGNRLVAAFEESRLRLAPDLFWNGPRFGWELPPRIVRALSNSSLAVIKGDANYRRVIGDAVWPADAPLAPIAATWPCPIVLLRTLKSDAVLGLPKGLDASLDATNPGWRVEGKRGVIQGAFGQR